MTKSAYIRARVEPDLKKDAEAIFAELGVNPSQVITMLYKQVARNHELPLELKLPNKETKEAIKAAREGQGLHKRQNVDEFFDDLGL